MNLNSNYDNFLGAWSTMKSYIKDVNITPEDIANFRKEWEVTNINHKK